LTILANEHTIFVVPLLTAASLSSYFTPDHSTRTNVKNFRPIIIATVLIGVLGRAEFKRRHAQMNRATLQTIASLITATLLLAGCAGYMPPPKLLEPITVAASPEQFSRSQSTTAGGDHPIDKSQIYFRYPPGFAGMTNGQFMIGSARRESESALEQTGVDQTTLAIKFDDVVRDALQKMADSTVYRDRLQVAMDQDTAHLVMAPAATLTSNGRVALLQFDLTVWNRAGTHRQERRYFYDVADVKPFSGYPNSWTDNDAMALKVAAARAIPRLVQLVIDENLDGNLQARAKQAGLPMVEWMNSSWGARESAPVVKETNDYVVVLPAQNSIFGNLLRMGIVERRLILPKASVRK
jgi:hypothetical protein